jgi:hypothetical protein
MNTYTDCISYMKAPTGIDVSGFVGNIGMISSVMLGSNTLSVPALTLELVQYDPIYIFDGANSEVLQVGNAGAGIGATSIPLESPTQYVHVGGVAYCTDGDEGSLGAQIVTASRWIEDICHQSLWGTAYVNEILTMPTMRAALDNQQNLHFRPRHFPIMELTTVSVQTNAYNIVQYDPTQAIIDSDQQTVDIPSVAILATTAQGSQQGYPWGWSTIGRTTTAWITITYLASFTESVFPATVGRACILLVSECFGQLENSVGADQIVQGKRNVTFTLRGDQSGESLLVKQAEKLLAPYIMQSF